LKTASRDPSSINRYIGYLFCEIEIMNWQRRRGKRVSYGFKSSREETIRYIELSSAGRLMRGLKSGRRPFARRGLRFLLMEI
jgi:hypothetical protein